MRRADVPALLAELLRLGVTVRPDGEGSLDVLLPPDLTSPAEVVRKVRAAKGDLLEHFRRTAEPPPVLPAGLPAWEGDPAVYGADALPRRHAPPGGAVPEDRPHVRADRVCGGCARWRPDFPGAEGGDCLAGWAAHGLAPIPGLSRPVTSRGSRCWAWGGAGWRPGVRA